MARAKAKNPKVTREALCREAARKSGLRKHACARTLNAFLSVLSESLIGGGTVEIRGHFTLVPKTRKDRPARNIRTGERVMLGERKTAVARFVRGYLG